MMVMLRLKVIASGIIDSLNARRVDSFSHISITGNN